MDDNGELGAYIEPIIQRVQENWMAVRREYRSAMKDDMRAPKKEPKGIEAVMAP